MRETRDTILLVIVSGDCKNTIIFAISLFFYYFFLYFTYLFLSSGTHKVDEKNSLRKSRTKEKGELFEAVFFDFFIQEQLKVINLWGY